MLIYIYIYILHDMYICIYIYILHDMYIYIYIYYMCVCHIELVNCIMLYSITSPYVPIVSQVVPSSYPGECFALVLVAIPKKDRHW